MTPGNTDEKEPLTVATDDLILMAGTPIVCHGLGISSHPNGKTGYLRSWDKATDCYRVYFEDKYLEPCSVFEDEGPNSSSLKLENIPITFELPDIIIKDAFASLCMNQDISHCQQ